MTTNEAGQRCRALEEQQRQGESDLQKMADPEPGIGDMDSFDLVMLLLYINMPPEKASSYIKECEGCRGT